MKIEFESYDGEVPPEDKHQLDNTSQESDLESTGEDPRDLESTGEDDAVIEETEALEAHLLALEGLMDSLKKDGEFKPGKLFLVNESLPNLKLAHRVGNAEALYTYAVESIDQEVAEVTEQLAKLKNKA